MAQSGTLKVNQGESSNYLNFIDLRFEKTLEKHSRTH